MIGKFRLKFKLAVIAVTGILNLSVSNAFANCQELLDDFEATSIGVQVNYDEETGKIRSFAMAGEASFIAPKSSLVRKAKKKAIMFAKAEFSRFMKEDFNAADLTSDLTNIVENTDSAGNTSGNAEEISSMVETMASNTSAVLNGIVTLGECVDTEQKLVRVVAGWKPELSVAASDAKQTIKKEVARGDAPVTSSQGANSSSASSATGKVTGVKSYSKKSKMAKDF